MHLSLSLVRFPLKLISNHNLVFLVTRCATARAGRSTRWRWAIWWRLTWTNTNTPGNTRKEMTQERHGMVSVRLSEPLTVHEEAFTAFRCCITVCCLFSCFWSYLWVWSQTSPKPKPDLICSQLLDGTFFSNVEPSVYTELGGQLFLLMLISRKAPLGVCCVGFPWPRDCVFV